MYFYIYGKKYNIKRKFNQVDKYFALFFWFNKKKTKKMKKIYGFLMILFQTVHMFISKLSKKML